MATVSCASSNRRSIAVNPTKRPADSPEILDRKLSCRSKRGTPPGHLHSRHGNQHNTPRPSIIQKRHLSPFDRPASPHYRFHRSVRPDVAFRAPNGHPGGRPDPRVPAPRAVSNPPRQRIDACSKPRMAGSTLPPQCRDPHPSNHEVSSAHNNQQVSSPVHMPVLQP